MQGWCFPTAAALHFQHLQLTTCPQALLEFEGLWHQAWLRGIDNAKAQLQATLLVQDPTNGAHCSRQLTAGFRAADPGSHVDRCSSRCCPCARLPHQCGMYRAHQLPSPSLPHRQGRWWSTLTRMCCS